MDEQKESQSGNSDVVIWCGKQAVVYAGSKEASKIGSDIMPPWLCVGDSGIDVVGFAGGRR